MRRHHWIVLFLVLASAVLLRSQRIGYDAISLDEMWHLALSTGRGSPQLTCPADQVLRDAPAWTDLATAPPWYAAWGNMDRVLHPPLFVLTLRLWRECFGGGDLAAQWYVAAWSVATIILTFDFVRAVTGRTAPALWAAALLAVAPTQILHAQEIRAYPMLAALTAAMFGVAARIDRDGPNARRMAILCALMLAAMLTHYFALGPCIAIGLWTLARTRGPARARIAAAFALTAIVYLAVWGPSMTRQIADIGFMTDAWLKDTATGATARTLARALAAPARQLVDHPSIIASVFGLAIMAAAVGGAWRRREMTLAGVWLASTIGFLLLLDLSRQTRHLDYLRYALDAAPAVAAIVAICLWSCGRAWLLHGVCGGACAAMLALNSWAYESDEPDYRLLREFMVERVGPGETMLFYSGPQKKGYFNEILMLAATREPGLFPRDVVKLSARASPELIGSLHSRTAWLFTGPLDEPVEQFLAGSRLVEKSTLFDRRFGEFVTCYHVELPRP